MAIRVILHFPFEKDPFLLFIMLMALLVYTLLPVSANNIRNDGFEAILDLISPTFIPKITKREFANLCQHYFKVIEGIEVTSEHISHLVYLYYSTVVGTCKLKEECIYSTIDLAIKHLESKQSTNSYFNEYTAKLNYLYTTSAFDNVLIEGLASHNDFFNIIQFHQQLVRSKLKYYNGSVDVGLVDDYYSILKGSYPFDIDFESTENFIYLSATITHINRSLDIVIDTIDKQFILYILYFKNKLEAVSISNKNGL